MWASQAVACPYCRNVVTAPASSNWPPADVPVASPVTPQAFGDTTDAAQPLPLDTSRAPRTGATGNRAVWAFVCALVAAFLCCIATYIFGTHMVNQAVAQVGPNASVEELQREMQKLMTTPGGVQYPVPSVTFFFAGMILALISIWLAVQALIYQESRRILAIVACMVSACFTFCQVMMMLAALASRSSAGQH